MTNQVVNKSSKFQYSKTSVGYDPLNFVQVNSLISDRSSSNIHLDKIWDTDPNYSDNVYFKKIPQSFKPILRCCMLPLTFSCKDMVCISQIKYKPLIFHDAYDCLDFFNEKLNSHYNTSVLSQLSYSLDFLPNGTTFNWHYCAQCPLEKFLPPSASHFFRSNTPLNYVCN